ncbi:Carbon storage regulator [Thioalkalivibrio nitratireducens DSM 14787]|uniref:Translational regulator CsrA n=1 Tax=Thioalkalivibrio nitratireducens (strain DSM 14787 / UNIQEM 213 / ALEN2) TaxID=1255043 RepID=L0DVR7_THIND|nr:carbon storage regulator [Thioalkalivibrio nitratireducens]AGA33128.1 Carbon storage regulator [Thioalkalivibrio nitratireducens DSM 14787]
MFIQTRRTGETLRIGDQVHLTVLSVKDNQVRIGIAAARDVKVLRKELVRDPADLAPEGAPTPEPPDAPAGSQGPAPGPVARSSR